MYRDFSTNKALALCHRWQWSSIYFARIIPFADISSPSRLFQKWWLGNRFEGKVERNGVKKRIIFYVPQISFTELVLPLSFSLDISSPNSLIVSLLHVHCPVFLCHPSSSHCSLRILLYTRTNLSFLANSNPFFIPFSFRRKVYTPSFLLSQVLSRVYIYSTVRNSSNLLSLPRPIETPISRNTRTAANAAARQTEY